VAKRVLEYGKFSPLFVAQEESLSLRSELVPQSLREAPVTFTFAANMRTSISADTRATRLCRAADKSAAVAKRGELPALQNICRQTITTIS
jgi:hypothetical protein